MLFSKGLVESRPAVVGPLSAEADGYHYVAQHLDKVVKQDDNDKESRNESFKLWNVGAVIPDSVKARMMQQHNGKVYAIASTMPDVSVSGFKTVRHLVLTCQY